ncbi:MAG: DegT/DnrJ/EryC1/StrS family aminotransferase [Actinomycetes bacterium]
MTRLYLSPPDMSGSERERLIAAFDSNWITTLGAEVDGFEADVCAYTGAPAAVALSSGTAALHLALLLAGVGSGDEVLVSSLTFAAPANAVTYVGAVPTFVDCEPQTWNMDPELLEATLVDRAAADRLPAAVIVVDIYGQCAQLDRIVSLCDSYGVPVIEDAAEALGATWSGRHAGTWGMLGAFSFNGNKIITTGGGGMLVGEPELIDRARYLSQQARQPVLHYEHTDIGFNYRLSNLLAAVGRGQLAELPGKIDRRHEIHARYQAGLAGIDGVDFMPWDSRGRPNGWLTLVTIDPSFGVTPHDVCAALDQQDIEARPAWKPMHLQPVFSDHPTVGGAVSAQLFDRGLCLPSGSAMTHADVDRVVAALREVLGVS